MRDKVKTEKLAALTEHNYTVEERISFMALYVPIGAAKTKKFFEGENLGIR